MKQETHTVDPAPVKRGGYFKKLRIVNARVLGDVGGRKDIEKDSDTSFWF